jgi:hypothetical protein
MHILYHIHIHTQVPGTMCTPRYSIHVDKLVAVIAHLLLLSTS